MDLFHSDGTQLLANDHLFMPERGKQVTPDELDKIYHKLAKIWHPDRHGGSDLSNRVFAHITAQYQLAKRGEYKNTVTIRTRDGSTLVYPYIVAKPFELGELFVCERYLIWSTRRDADDLVKRALSVLKNLKFDEPARKIEFEKYLPRSAANVIAYGDRTYWVVHRPDNYVRVADVLELGPMPPKAVAWTLSSAYNMACALNYSKVSHLDVSPETYFIEPKMHVGALLGGWYYTGIEPERSLAVPARSSYVAKLERNRAVLTQIKSLGRRALGASSVVALNRVKDLPPAYRDWLVSPAGDDPVREYAAWHKAVETSYGPRRFTKYELSAADVYRKTS